MDVFAIKEFMIQTWWMNYVPWPIYEIILGFGTANFNVIQHQDVVRYIYPNQTTPLSL